MNVIDALSARCSCRAFTAEPVTRGLGSGSNARSQEAVGKKLD